MSALLLGFKSESEFTEGVRKKAFSEGKNCLKWNFEGSNGLQLFVLDCERV